MILPPLPGEETQAEEDAKEISEPGEGDVEVSELKKESPVVVPDWIKSNAKWWSDNVITDIDFSKGIEHLIKNDIIKIPAADVLENKAKKDIPDWVKSNAGWWSDGLLTDQDFVNGIQWLIKNGIITI